MGKQKKTAKPSRGNTRVFLFIPYKVWWGLGILAGAALLWQLAMILSFNLTPARTNYTFGTSFSKRQAETLGLDWKANFTALLDDAQVRSFRLMSYWNGIEYNRGAFDFASLDWQMDEAAKRGAKVSLAIGLRQPRWPECHAPEWTESLETSAFRQALYAFLEKVVKRYEHHPALENFQLENEAFAWWFGQCRFSPDHQQLAEEYNLVDSWTDKPIWMSLSDQYGIPVYPPIADGLGYSLYTKVYNNIMPGTYASPSPPVWYHRLRADILRLLYHREMFLHELQLEPWGPRDIQYLSREEQDVTMDAGRIHYNLLLARKIGFDHVYTWGSEWWYWRKVQGDNTIWNAVKSEIQDSKTRAN